MACFNFNAVIHSALNKFFKRAHIFLFHDPFDHRCAHSCHTAIVDGYVIEGHVPATEIKRLLDEHPEVIGIAVADMPPGLPGMDIFRLENDPYDVVSFDEVGKTEIYASYPK